MPKRNNYDYDDFSVGGKGRWKGSQKEAKNKDKKEKKSSREIKQETKQRNLARDEKKRTGRSNVMRAAEPVYPPPVFPINTDSDERNREREQKNAKEDGNERAKDFVRKLQGFVEHRIGVKKVEKQREGVKKTEEIEMKAKKHLAVIAKLGSVEKKAIYIAKLVELANKRDNAMWTGEKEKEEEEKKEEEEEKEEGEEISKKSEKMENDDVEVEEDDMLFHKDKLPELVHSILGHFFSDELDHITDILQKKKVDLTPLVTEEVMIESMTRTLNGAKKQLLGEKINVSQKLDSSFIMPAFDDKGYAQKYLVVQRLDESEKNHPLIMFENTFATESLKYGMRSVIPSREMFKHAFDAFTMDFFKGVDLTGGIITGGAICACLQPLPAIFMKYFKQYRAVRRAVRAIPLPGHILDRISYYSGVEELALKEYKSTLTKHYFTTKSPFETSDVDVFITANSLEEAERRLRRLYKNIKARAKQLGLSYITSRTNNAITFFFPNKGKYEEYNFRCVQLVVSALRSPSDFLLFCDLDCTSVAYDGHDVYMSPRSVRAFNKRYNLLPPDFLQSNTKCSRVFKYATRGFSTLVFELCKHVPRCDVFLSETNFDSFVKLAFPRQFRKLQLMRMGDYEDCRPFSGTNITIQILTDYFVTHNVPFGWKFKSVWTTNVKTLEEVEAETEKRREENRRRRKQEEWQRREERRRRRQGDEEFDEEELDEWDTEYEEEEEKEKEGGRYFSNFTGENIKPKPAEPSMRWKWVESLQKGELDDLLPRCYMCGKRDPRSFQTDKTGLSLCTDCKMKNEHMMNQWDNITNIEDCVALITGARIKIGYYIALRLLKSGATVIAVTRFPHDAALRYSQEPDFENWKDNLHIYGVDLRHLPSVNEFIAHILQHYKRIDMLVNNAAQTKRRPRAYYYEVIQRERQLMGGDNLQISFLVKNFSENPHMITFDISPDSPTGRVEGDKRERGEEEPEKNSLVPVMELGSLTIDPTLPRSAALTQVQLHPMDAAERDDNLFPPGLVDEHNEPLDLRTKMSWNQAIDEISTVELVEVQIVNSTVPFMFISSFKPLLKKAAEISHHKRAFIVNVTAVEGNFMYNKKSGGHPHTNMAKAALNMMTKSIADTFAVEKIYTTAVDTGWCTEMRYVPMDQRDEKGVPLNPVPLTDRDGAARVLYPIYAGLTSEAPPPHGVLYHDFEVVPWT